MQQRKLRYPNSVLARPEHWEQLDAGKRPIEVEIFNLRNAIQIAYMRLGWVQERRKYEKIIENSPLRLGPASPGDNRISPSDLANLTDEQLSTLFAEDAAIEDAYRTYVKLAKLHAPERRMMHAVYPAFTAAAELEATNLEAPRRAGK